MSEFEEEFKEALKSIHSPQDLISSFNKDKESLISSTSSELSSVPPINLAEALSTLGFDPKNPVKIEFIDDSSDPDDFLDGVLDPVFFDHQVMVFELAKLVFKHSIPISEDSELFCLLEHYGFYFTDQSQIDEFQESLDEFYQD